MTVALPSRAPDYEIIWPADGTYGLGDPLYFTGGVALFLDEWATQDNNYVIGTDSVGKYVASGNAGRSNDGVDFGTFLTEREDAIGSVVTQWLSDGETVNLGRFTHLRARATPHVPIVIDLIKSASPFLGYQSEVHSNTGENLELPHTDTHYREVRTQSTPTRTEVSWLAPTVGPGEPLDMGADRTSGSALRWHEPNTLSIGLGHKLYAFNVWNETESTGAGMWATRQRQALAGNAGGWPLRQRQNGNATGTWPLRQRQNGL